MTIFRPANENDLAAMYQIYYLNEVQEAQSPPVPESTPVMLRYVLQSGRMYVAEQDGQLLGFAGAITRGVVTYLTDLFVHPQAQSSGLGKTLLQHALPQEGYIHCTMSSTDPRAQALYIRSGMQPAFPHFNLRWHEAGGKQQLSSDVEVVEGHAEDVELIRWDTRVSGRERPQDHAFWVRQQRAVPLWFRRQGRIVGYGYVRLGAGTLWYPEACTVGPVGVDDPEHATDCVLAATQWAELRAKVVRIDIPGPHPCLASLLARGFHIVYVETFLSTASRPFFDARCYIPSGSDLL